MAVATYNTDLTTMNNAESGNWYEFTATGWDTGDNPTAESDFFIQGAGCRSSDTNNKTGICSGAFDYGSDLSGSFTDGETVMLIWHVLLPGNAMNVAPNGLRVVVGASLTAFTWWPAGGRDAGRNPLGGWQCYAVDPSNTGGTAVGGGHGGVYRYFGAAADVISAIAKGTMHGWDAVRYGRGEIYVEYGDTGAGTFAGIAQYNDYNDATNGYNRFGLFQAQQGSYLWKGLLSLGTASNAVTFTDANRTITIDDTPNTYPTFNKIEIVNASSVVTWENISFKALGTYAPGILEVVDNADVNISSCSFQGMGIFTFLSNSDVLSSIFKSCQEIDAGGGHFTSTRVLTPVVAADSYGILWNVATDPDGYLDNMEFTKGTNDHHAIEFGLTSPTSMVLRGVAFSGFGAQGTNAAALNVLRTSGTVTINLVGCSGTINYKSAGATVVLVVNPVTTTITVLKPDGAPLTTQNALVLVEAGDDTGDLPFEASVSITRSGSTATVSHTGHGLETGDKVCIRGADQYQYNGVFTITYINADSYSYTVTGTPDTPATGTITSTGVAVYGWTGVTGQVSGSRTFTVDQPIRGAVRKASGSPYYKRINFTDTIDKDDGLPKTVQFVSDE